MAPNVIETEFPVNGPEAHEIYVDGVFLTMHNEISAQFEVAAAAFRSPMSEVEPLVRRYNFDVATHGYPEGMVNFLKDFICKNIHLDMIDDQNLVWVFNLLSCYGWSLLKQTAKECLKNMTDPCSRFIMTYCYVNRHLALFDYTSPFEHKKKKVPRPSDLQNKRSINELLREVPIEILSECILVSRESFHYDRITVDVFAEQTRRAGYFGDVDTIIPDPITPSIIDEYTIPVSDEKFSFCKPADFWRRFDHYTLGIFHNEPDANPYTSLCGFRNIRVTGGIICKLIRGDLPDYETDIDIFVHNSVMHEVAETFIARFPNCEATVQNKSIINIRVPDPEKPSDPTRIRKFQLVPSDDPTYDILKFDLTNNMLWIIPGTRKLFASIVAYSDLLNNRATMLTQYTKSIRMQKAAAIIGNIRIASKFCLANINFVFGPNEESRQPLLDAIRTATHNEPQAEVPFEHNMHLRTRQTYIDRFPSIFKYEDPRYNAILLSTFSKIPKTMSFGSQYFTINDEILTINPHVADVITQVASNINGRPYMTPTFNPIWVGLTKIKRVVFRVESDALIMSVDAENDYMTMYNSRIRLCV